MDEKKKIGCSYALLVIILFATVCFLTVYIVVDRKLNDNKGGSTTNNSVTDNANNSSNSNIKELNINSEQVQTLYGYIPVIDSNWVNLNAYQNNIVTLKEMSNSDLLGFAFRKVNISESEKVPYKTIDGEILNPDSLEWYGFNSSILQNKVKELYGENLPNENFAVIRGASCYYNETDDKYYYSIGGGDAIFLTSIRNIDKAYSDNENLYIEDKYMAYVGIYVDIANSPSEMSFSLYTSSDRTDKIVDLDESTRRTNTDAIEELKNKYGNSMKKYKHTFKKNDDGSYYWYSTEPMEN